MDAKHSENVSVDGDRYHCRCEFLYLPALVWTEPETQSQSRLRRIGKETKTQDHNPDDSRTDVDYNRRLSTLSSIFILFIESFIKIKEQLDTYLFLHYFQFEPFQFFYLIR